MAAMVMVSGCIPVKPFSARPASVTVKPRPLGRSTPRPAPNPSCLQDISPSSWLPPPRSASPLDPPTIVLL